MSKFPMRTWHLRVCPKMLSYEYRSVPVCRYQLMHSVGHLMLSYVLYIKYLSNTIHSSFFKVKEGQR